MNIEKQYNLIGKKYVEGQKEFFSKRDDVARKFIKICLPKNLKNRKILDIGCGHGADIRFLESLGAKSVYGIDASRFMIDEAKKRVKNPRNLSVQNINKTKFEDSFFDVVISRYTLHYLKKIDPAYKEISRILKKNGIFIFVVHHPLKDFANQKNKKYGKQEIIKKELYGGKVSISFPTHSFKDYLSETFFRDFYIDLYEEKKTPEENQENNLPGFMGIKAIKR